MLARGELSVHASFGCALKRLWLRDGIVVDDPDALADTVAASFAKGHDDARAASELLRRSGVSAQWNKILRTDRAVALATRIRPLITEPLLDVLSGDGSICRALSDLGVASLAATERSGDYSESVRPSHVPFEPFADDLDLAQFGAATALLSTVLHHEPDPVRLLDALAHSRIPRWIVVENCVTAQFSRPFHQFADQFFNRCLNEFGCQCVEQHRTLDEWVEMLTAYGSVAVINEAFTVPGIPFPYSLLVVSRDVGVGAS
jgi:hypothetical protein